VGRSKAAGPCASDAPRAHRGDQLGSRINADAVRTEAGLQSRKRDHRRQYHVSKGVASAGAVRLTPRACGRRVAAELQQLGGFWHEADLIELDGKDLRLESTEQRMAASPPTARR
jgi:hypothetical protein